MERQRKQSPRLISYLFIITATVTAAGLNVVTPHLAGAASNHRGDLNDAGRVSAESRAAATLRAAGAQEKARLNKAYGRLPLSFEANHGQVDPQVRFFSRGGGFGIFLTPAGAIMTLSRRAAPGEVTRGGDGATVSMRFVGANPQPEITGLNELSSRSNYLIGRDARKWRADVVNYGTIKYEDAYPGIDVLYYGNRGRLEYDFVVAPEADVKSIKLAFEGAQGVRVGAGGDLIIRAGGGEVRQSRPVVYQEVDGHRRVVAGRYVLTGRGQVGFAIGRYDRSRALFIDPVLSYSTYLGGNGEDQGADIALDAAGNAYVTGTTVSGNFPVAGGGTAAAAGSDIFVTKLNPTGNQAIYSTYLGGSGDDEGMSIAVDASGKAYVTGATRSIDFPTKNALQDTYGGEGFTDGDAYVVKLNQAGNGLEYATYLGGGGDDRGNSIAVDSSGCAYVTGYTGSGNFPTRNPPQVALNGATDVFLTKLGAAGDALVYSTYLGGGGDDYGRGLALDASGNAFITGYTNSGNFPLSAALQATAGGSLDAFVVKMNQAGSALAYSTYLGGAGDDLGEAVAVDSSGSAYVTGRTDSSNFPVQGAYTASRAGGYFDAFVTKLTAGGGGLVYSTYLGGNGEESGQGIAVDAAGSAYVTGFTSSSDYPTTNALQAILRGNSDAFVTKFNSAGSALSFSTYFGGSPVFIGQTGSDSGNGIALDTFRNIYVAGTTTSTANFPIQRPFQLSFRGGTNDAFVSRINDGTTFTIGGTVQDLYGNGVGGATLTLGGAQQATAQSDAAGNFVFGNLAAGDYTLTPSKTDYTLSPSSQTFNGLNSDAAATFTATSPYNISGHVTDAGGLPVEGALMTLSGSQAATAQTDAAGNYSFNVAPGGSYLITPSKFTYAFAPASRSFNNVSGSLTADFTGSLSQFNVSGHVADTAGVALGGATVTLSGSQAATTQTDAAGNYVFNDVPAGGSYTVTPSLTGYGFTPPSRSFANLGADRTVNFVGRSCKISGRLVDAANGAGLPGMTVDLAGGQTASTQTDANGNYSFNVTPGLNYFVTPHGPHRAFSPDIQSFPSLAADQTANFSGTLVYDITGVVLDPDGFALDLVRLNLSGSATASMLTDVFNPSLHGRFEFTRLPAAGNYTVTPSKAGYIFAPSSLSFNPLSSDKTVTFRATATRAISGQVTTSGGAPLSGVTVTLGGSQTATRQTNASGNYSFSGLPHGSSYTLTPSKTNYVFGPATQSVNNLSADQTVNFQGTFAYTISGRLANDNGAGVSGATVTLSGSQTASAQTDANGNYSIPGLAPGGSYRVTPSKAGSGFNPQSQTFSNLSGNQTANFIAGTAGTFILNPTADAHVRNGASANVNFGTAVTLEVMTSATANDGNSRDTYFIYDTGGVGAIGAAKLRVYASLSAAGTVATTVYPVLNVGWVESGTGSITWNNKPALGAALGSVSVTGTTSAWYEIDVTAYVKSERAAGRNVVALCLHNAASSTVNLKMSAREATANRPELFISPETAVNTAPTVNAGPDQQISLPDSVTLDAAFADDGLPSPPAALTFAWSKVSGPGTVTFGSPAAADTTAVFSTNGVYVLQLQANDGALSATDQVQVTVLANPAIKTLNPTADSYVRDGSANAGVNFGTATALSVRTDTAANTGNNRDAYLKFDMTTAASIGSAKLRVFAALSAAGTVSTSVYPVATTTWVESGTGSITWNNKPARGATALSSVSVTGMTAAWYELDVTSYLQSERVAGRNVVSFALHDAAAATPIINFNSREATANKPELVITAVQGNGPKLFSLSPSFGLAGTLVTIRGLNFGATAGTSTVKFNGVSATPTGWSANSITVAVPAGAATGPVVVTVGGVASAGMIFTVAGAESDTDADGLPDSWERMYFGSLSQTASADFDGDGVTNLQEYQQGRNPSKATIFDAGGAVNLKVWTPLENFQ